MDTIAAISTPPGIGGISIVRISGKKSLDILKKIFKPVTPFEEFVPRKACFGKIYDPETGKILDHVVATFFKAPNSYTGEDVVEISCHGGRLVPYLVLEVVLKSGARLAKRGEFTERAFLNGKLDLLQSQAILDLVNAKSPKAVELALNKLEGLLSQKVSELQEKLFNLIVEIEARIDFEEDVPPLDNQFVLERVDELISQVKKIIGEGKRGNYGIKGIKVAIIGEPNVGKSTLFNKILGYDRAIVTEIPGTTRDVLREEIVLENMLFLLYDTAGLREVEDKIEFMGIERTWKTIDEVDIILDVRDATNPHYTPPYVEKINKTRITIFNKIDLIGEEKIKELKKQGFVTSAINNLGINEIVEALIEKGKEIVGGEYSLSDREIFLFQSMENDLKESRESLIEKLGLEITAFHLEEAYKRLQEIVGYHDLPEKILNSIFENFCVGK